MDYLNCYICNSETKLQNSVRIRTKTKYSSVGVHEIIQSFLKESHTLRFSPNDIVCERCFQKINQYDLACRMADEIQQEVTNALYATEQQYLNDEPVEFLDDTHNDKTNCQKDFEEFQVQYEMENVLGKVDNQDENTETMLISSIDEGTVEVMDQSNKTNEVTKSKRKRGIGCDECDIPCNTKKELKQHQQRYHTPKKCGVCQVVFANQVELKNHTRQDHEIEHSIEQSSNDEAEYNRADASASESESSLRCEICGITESTNESLSNHVALHENQLKCVVCGTVLKHRSNLILHMRIHADKKFFKCDKCEKTFVHKSSLRMHLQTTHTDVRNKQCPECPLKFKTTSQLNQHIVTHTGVKAHQCPECGKAFGQKYNMTAHYKSHFFYNAQRRVRTQTEPTSNANVKMDL